jgi:serine phosphatase RsbU (regulator of sigma subunit)
LTNIRELEERDREIREKNEQMETDLRMATELQQALMPSAYSSIPAGTGPGTTRLRFCHRYLSATLMGGDFFHIERLSDETAAVCICDVMGKESRQSESVTQPDSSQRTLTRSARAGIIAEPI